MFAITGHTKGIGRALYAKIDALGFSRSNGYDISSKEDRKRILEESRHCSVFVNNAYSGFSQSNLLLEWFEYHKHEDKTIINVGSNVAEDFVVLPEERHHLLNYQMHKKSLKQLSNDLSKQNVECSIHYVTFGYVGTDRILSKYPNLEQYISVEEAVDIILSPINIV